MPTPLAPATATVGLTSTQIVAANPARTTIVITNTSGLAMVSLGFGYPAVMSTGITLQPGQSYSMDALDLSSGVINAISSIAGTVLSIQEHSNAN